jgi:hypothetical protein
MPDTVYTPQRYPTFVAGTITGDDEIIEAPGEGFRLVIASFIVQNLEDELTVIELQNGDTTFWRVVAPTIGDGLVQDNERYGGWRLDENAALNIAISASSVSYSVAYLIERVP